MKDPTSENTVVAAAAGEATSRGALACGGCADASIAAKDAETLPSAPHTPNPVSVISAEGRSFAEEESESPAAA